MKVFFKLHTSSKNFEQFIRYDDIADARNAFEARRFCAPIREYDFITLYICDENKRTVIESWVSDELAFRLINAGNHD